VKETPDAVTISRRELLRRALAAGGALGAGMALDAGAGVPDAEARAAPRAPKRPGYRETDHVREYYAKASL
jgi:hypothetical protein